MKNYAIGDDGGVMSRRIDSKEMRKSTRIIDSLNKKRLREPGVGQFRNDNNYFGRELFTPREDVCVIGNAQYGGRGALLAKRMQVDCERWHPSLNMA